MHAWEREVEQTLLVSVDMDADVRKAAATDDLADALDYSAVAETIAAVLRDGKFRLIETAAERVAERLLADFPVSWLRLELRKPIAGTPTPPVHIRHRCPRPRHHPRIHRRHHHRPHPRNFMIMKDFSTPLETAYS